MITIHHNGIIKIQLDISLSTARKVVKVLRDDIPGTWFLSATTTGKNAPTFVFGDKSINRNIRS